ncbi:hypothetical protein VF_B0025 (plasmid) [Aliivibrio fischeri ES114]|uniref:Toxin co-regulated pilus biosynthesis protein Q C-terminal domain-containing protein n=2 Tax=Aliivibrio fischeri TaxID=668 RepID=Q5DY79_ALIF1|nr:hypothetical protein [Aliivibrio fischeri]AAW88267.1 hypothetical protein VF_B0025 [Aliivibrio fischeri ES114]AEY78135.1 hypothetical protein [Aliivibrio fischeri]KLU77242.1 hypothetical protein AB192_18790 [Aliivibrio fischeri]MUK41505.1 hypothetical protein [Aliivibrio fischeri]
MRKQHLLATSLLVILSGCASEPEYQGDGEYFELTNRHVIERDLSVFRSTTVINTSKAAVAPITQPTNDYYEATISQGEAYNSAVKRWLKAEGYSNIAWSLSDNNRAILSSPSTSELIFSGSLKQALVELSEHLHMPINLIVDEKAKVAGIYDFNDDVRITHVQGDSLRQVTKHLIENYGLRWNDTEDSARSWLVDTNYQFSADYYIITQYDDISTALETVLEGYPVYSEILESTGQVFIQEEL